MSTLLRLLTQIYGTEAAPAVFTGLQEVLARYTGRIPAPTHAGLTERDAVLITYGDQITAPDEAPLRTLADFCRTHLAEAVSGVHLLPFYPWSSDDGFAVKDYRAIDPALGTWDDVAAFTPPFRMMFDAVINHASAQGAWFAAFVRDEAPYRDYFFTVTGQPDLSAVVRPRALPLLTRFETASGPRHVWTTFSADQVDLDYRNPAVLLEMVDIVLMYAQRGAHFIRLDAIAYMWKEVGTNCIHLPQTHALIQLLRAVMDVAAPHVRLITETNVPHADNVAYFGDGHNEAHLVYNFALPPLTLHALRTGHAQALTEWAAGLRLPSNQTAFFNFLASHDGIGLNPARGILISAEVDDLVAGTLARGGLISYKHNPDGTHSPYEMNINYFDALGDPNGAEPLATHVDRFMAAQAIMLALAGVPGIYVHSLLGSRNWPEGVAQTGHNRSINRQKFTRAALEAELADPTNLRHQVLTRYRQLLQARASTPAFHPQGGQTVLDLHPHLFAVKRTAPHGHAQVLAVHNVSAHPVTLNLAGHLNRATDLLTGQPQPITLTWPPYAVRWLSGA